jgi:hypothetical protein
MRNEEGGRRREGSGMRRDEEGRRENFRAEKKITVLYNGVA